MPRKSSYNKIFLFLEQKEKVQENFTIEEISSFCNVKKNTIERYFSGKLYEYILKFNNNGKISYKAKNILNTSYEKFELKISQANLNKITEVELYCKKLIEKSFDAFLIAIENYNKPNLKNKVEVFSILIINAWELLLKAKLIKDNNDKKIIFKERKDKEEYTISIEDCVKKIYQEKDVIRVNLLQLIKLRDKATHLLIEEIRYSLSQLFQSSIINYIEEYKVNFGEIPLVDDMTGMLCLIILGKNKTSEIKNIYGDKTDYEINEFLTELKKLEKEYDSDNFMTNINYSAYLEKKEKNANITITKGSNGENAIILEKMIDPKGKYKYTYKEIVILINKIYPKFTKYIMQLFMRKYKIYNNEDYHYEYRKTNSYSEKLVNLIKLEISKDINFFENIKK